MKRGPQGRYSKEFREEAVKLVTEESLSVPEVGRQGAIEQRSPDRCLY